MGKSSLQKSALVSAVRHHFFLKWLSPLSLFFILALAVVSLTPTRSHAVGPSQPTSASQAGSTWNNLTPAQKQALAPLANEWATMSVDRQKKWLLFSDKFQKMKPEDQQRTQGKMAAWFKLTPEQRLAARENYIRSNKLQPDLRTQKWEEYQQLSDEEKAQLASHEKKQLITNLPTPAESKEQKLQPLKKPKKPVSTRAPATASQPAATVMPAPIPPSTSN